MCESSRKNANERLPSRPIAVYARVRGSRIIVTEIQIIASPSGVSSLGLRVEISRLPHDCTQHTEASRCLRRLATSRVRARPRASIVDSFPYFPPVTHRRRTPRPRHPPRPVDRPGARRPGTRPRAHRGRGTHPATRGSAGGSSDRSPGPVARLTKPSQSRELSSAAVRPAPRLRGTERCSVR